MINYKAVVLTITLLINFQIMNSQNSIYDISINGLNNNEIDLSQFKGKYMLFVNVASKCGFTGQYEGLQELYEKYKSKLVVIGVPSNQFGAQEPGTSTQIKEFCTNKFNVSFVMTEKTKVKGNKKHPIYEWLTNKNLNNVYSSSVKWNFQKYLVSPDGKLINYWYSLTKPMSSKITKYLE